MTPLSVCTLRLTVPLMPCAHPVTCAQETLGKPTSSLAIWLKCGHEMRQEAKKQLLQLLYVLADPDAALTEAGLSTQTPSQQPATDASATPAGRRADKRRPLDSSRRSGGLSPPPPLPPSIRPKDVLSPTRATSGLPPVNSASPAPAQAVSPEQATKRRPTVGGPGSVDPPSAAVSAVTHVDVLLERQKEVQREFREAQEAARRKEVEEEAERLAKLRRDQELRRKKWEEEDAQRLQHLRNTMSLRQEQRSQEVSCGRWIVLAVPLSPCSPLAVPRLGCQTASLLSYLQQVDEGASRRQRLLASSGSDSALSSTAKPPASPEARRTSLTTSPTAARGRQNATASPAPGGGASASGSATVSAGKPSSGPAAATQSPATKGIDKVLAQADLDEEEDKRHRKMKYEQYLQVQVCAVWTLFPLYSAATTGGGWWLSPSCDHDVTRAGEADAQGTRCGGGTAAKATGHSEPTVYRGDLRGDEDPGRHSRTQGATSRQQDACTQAGV